MARYLILAAVLVAGCEQIKSPQKLRDLEARVDKLSDDVAVLKGEKPKRTAHAGEGSGEGSEAGEGSSEPGGEGSGEHAAAAAAVEPGGEAAGSGEHTAAAGEHAAAAGEHPPAPGEHAPASGEHAPAAAAEPAGHGTEHAAAAGSAEPAAKSAEPAVKSAEHGDSRSAEHGDSRTAEAGSGGGSGSGSAKPPLDPAERGLAQLQEILARTKRGETGSPPDAKKPPPSPPLPASALSAMPHWGYEGANGPPTWGTLDPAWRTCMVGKAQSPIDIEPRSGNASPITFHYKPTASTLYDNGHTLQVDLAPGSTIEIAGAAYQLVQFHFHMPSEHTIAGERYPLEVHLVHQDGDGRIAVIGVLYDAGAESRPLNAVWSRWPRKSPGEDRTRKSFDPSDLLPEKRSVYRYTGSLTTPPCTEGVVWNVMRRTMTDSKAHIDGFARHYPHNARDVQPRNDRKIE